jgi:hypothetical protein
MAASNEQVQNWSNGRTRVRAEQIRAVLLSCEDDNASVGEVYANLTDSPTWDDARPDAPNELSANDLLAINTFCVSMANLIRNGKTGGSMTDQERIDTVKAMSDQLPIVLKACVRPV